MSVPWPAPLAASPVDATVEVPGSKSITARALYLAAVADSPSLIRVLWMRATLACSRPPWS